MDQKEKKPSSALPETEFMQLSEEALPEEEEQKGIIASLFSKKEKPNHAAANVFQPAQFRSLFPAGKGEQSERVQPVVPISA